MHLPPKGVHQDTPERAGQAQLPRTSVGPIVPSTHNPTRSLSKNAGLSVSYTNYQTPPQTTSAANLKLHTNSSSNPDTPPVSTSVNSLNSTLARAALKVQLGLFCSTAEECQDLLPESLPFSYHFISICQSVAHPQAG